MYGRPGEKITPLPAKQSHLTLRKHISAPTPPFRDLRRALDSWFFCSLSKCFKVGERYRGWGDIWAKNVCKAQFSTHSTNPHPLNFINHCLFGRKIKYTDQHIWCEFGDGSSCGRECNTETVLRHSGKTTPLFAQAINWPHSNLIWRVWIGSNTESKTGLKSAVGKEQQIFLSSSPVSLVRVPSTRRHSQYPCP